MEYDYSVSYNRIQNIDKNTPQKNDENTIAPDILSKLIPKIKTQHLNKPTTPALPDRQQSKPKNNIPEHLHPLLLPRQNHQLKSLQNHHHIHRIITF